MGMLVPRELKEFFEKAGGWEEVTEEHCILYLIFQILIFDIIMATNDKLNYSYILLGFLFNS